MPKTSDCDRCQFYAHNPHIVCAVHPQGVFTDPSRSVVTELGRSGVTEPSRSVERTCLDFRQDPNAPASEDKQGSPVGYYWWDGELYPIEPKTLTPEEQLQILDTNPIFT